MRKTTLKGAALVALAGTVLQFGGCLGGVLNPQRLLGNAVSYAVNEFLLDNAAVFDLVEDDGAASGG